MFHDILAAKKYQIKYTKLSYICSFGTAPHAKVILIKKFKKAVIIVFIFMKALMRIYKKIDGNYCQNF